MEKMNRFALLNFKIFWGQSPQTPILARGLRRPSPYLTLLGTPALRASVPRPYLCVVDILIYFRPCPPPRRLWRFDVAAFGASPLDAFGVSLQPDLDPHFVNHGYAPGQTKMAHSWWYAEAPQKWIQNKLSDSTLASPLTRGAWPASVISNGRIMVALTPSCEGALGNFAIHRYETSHSHATVRNHASYHAWSQDRCA